MPTPSSIYHGATWRCATYDSDKELAEHADPLFGYHAPRKYNNAFWKPSTRFQRKEYRHARCRVATNADDNTSQYIDNSADILPINSSAAMNIIEFLCKYNADRRAGKLPIRSPDQLLLGASSFRMAPPRPESRPSEASSVMHTTSLQFF
eukprot:3770971-Pleurochrysis_carterae.AAC.1